MPSAMPVSPSVENYAILKGIVSFRATGAAEFRDLGNAPEFEYTPEVEMLDHFSARAGVRAKDRSVAVQKGATVRLVLDEITAENLALGTLGLVEDHEDEPGAGAGRRLVHLLHHSAIEGALRCVGTNEVGRRLRIDIPKVSFRPQSSIAFISEDWATIEIEGEVLFDPDPQTGTGGYGTVTELGIGPEPTEPEEPDP